MCVSCAMFLLLLGLEVGMAKLSPLRLAWIPNNSRRSKGHKFHAFDCNLIAIANSSVPTLQNCDSVQPQAHPGKKEERCAHIDMGAFQSATSNLPA